MAACGGSLSTHIWLCVLCTYQCLAPPTLGRAIVGLGGAFDTKNVPGVGN